MSKVVPTDAPNHQYRRLNILIIVYAVIFSFLSNCYLLAYRNIWHLLFCIALFLILNLAAGFFVADTKNRRLRALCHGTVLLFAFCATFATSFFVQVLSLIELYNSDPAPILWGFLYCFLCNCYLLANGIVSVYLTSVQLGIRIRVLGVICGMIPLVNIVALAYITYKAYNELIFERAKEKLNASRAGKNICRTKYPIVFLHGVCFRDFKYLNYWGRIPAELEKNGAVIYYGNHQSADAIKNSAAEIAERIKSIVETTGCEKVNIIAHSKGGLDSRYAMEHLGLAPYVASLTTINTPHRGCIYAEWILFYTIKPIRKHIAASYNKAAKLLGDRKPDFLAAMNDLTMDHCEKFDRKTPPPEGVFCQSYGSTVPNARHLKMPFNLAFHFIKWFDGANDGIAGEESFSFGERYTCFVLPGRRGISHMDMTDIYRENIKGFDVREFYVDLVRDLKARGF